MNNVFMERAIELARNGIGFTSPNPVVGAVIEKGGHIIAEGWHAKAGERHAEMVAIDDVMAKSGIMTMDIDPTIFGNATLYVTLEPCSHKGKTPACSDAVIKAGFKKVCIGMKDPFSKVNGRGIRAIKKSGCKVEVYDAKSPVGDAVHVLNQSFIKWAKTGLPYVTLKAGMTIDGKIALGSGDSKWITDEASRTDAKEHRSICDAVLVGANTIKMDDPVLGVSKKYEGKRFLKVIIDDKLSCPLDRKIFEDDSVFVACTDLASDRNKAKYKKAGIKFKSFGKDSVSVKRLLKYLGKNDVQSLFVEGGSFTHGGFFDSFLKDSSLLDNVLFYLAPSLMGGSKNIPVVGGEGVTSMKKLPTFVSHNMESVGEGYRFRGLLNRY